MITSVRSRWVIFAVAVLIGVASITPALAKDYRFSAVEITASIEPDGSMTVAESRTFSFDGDFTFAYRDFPKSPEWEHRALAVFENEAPLRPAEPADREPVKAPGTYHTDDLGTHLRLTWFYRASDEERTFTIRYKVLRAVKAYDDVAELYWRFIGDEWTVGTGRARVTLLLPAPGAGHPDLRIWAHGPLNGVIRARTSTEIVAEVDSLDPRTFVEVRALFPPALVPGAERIALMRRGAVLEEERAFAEQANSLRERARRSIGLSIGLSLLGLAAFLYLFFRYGKEYQPEVGEYYHDLPTSQPPAVVGYLYRFGKTSADDLTATFLDLARRGHLRIEQRVQERFLRDKTIHQFERLQPSDPDRLKPFEGSLLEWAFDEVGDGTRVTDQQLAGHAREHVKDFVVWFTGWRKLIKEEADRSGWLERGSLARAWLNGAIGASLVLAGILIMATLESPAGIPPMFAGIVQIVLSPIIRRRSRRASEDYKKWKAFRRFLSDFSELSRMPPAALAIWDRYLVYAVPLGVADEVVDSMARLSPSYQQATGHGLYPVWIASSDGTSALPDLSALTSSLSSFTHAASSAMSSSGGGGGGFSGGGGGGGGGGGAG